MIGPYHQPQAEPWDMQEHNVEQLEMAHAELFEIVQEVYAQFQGWSPFEAFALRKMRWPHLYTALADLPDEDCSLETVANLSIRLKCKHSGECEFPQFPMAQAFIHSCINNMKPRFARMKADVLARGMDATLQYRMNEFQVGNHFRAGNEVVTLNESDAEALRFDCLQLYAPLRTWYDLAIHRSLPLSNEPICYDQKI